MGLSNKYHILILLLLLTVVTPSYSQTADADMVWQEIYNTLSDNDEYDEEGWNEIHDILTSLSHSPQNINDATYDDLLQIPLLTDRQRHDILKYRVYYGDIRSMSELSLVTSLDKVRLLILKAVFYAAPAKEKGYWEKRQMTDSMYVVSKDTIEKQKERWRYFSKKDNTKHSVTFTASIPTYKRQGYKDGTYLGSNINHSLRYRYNNGRYSAAFTAAQDAGEPFLKGTNSKGYDLYAAFVRVKNMGHLRNLVIGNYRLKLGMGLVMNTGYRISRMALLTTAPSVATVLRGHSSRQEYNMMQGAAATLAVPLTDGKELTFTPFVSYRKIDATPDKEIPGNINTILTTGYHRTESEIERRGITGQTIAGISATYNTAPFMTSLNVVYTTLSDSLSPGGLLYRKYRPTGKKFFSASMAYSYVNAKLQITGETAVSEKSRKEFGGGLAIATANSIRYDVSQTLTAFALQRYYSYRYQSLTANAFGDVSNAQNESGVYAGVSIAVAPRLTVAAYADMAYHPWVRYGYDRQSRSADIVLRATYEHKETKASIRYRYREQTETDGELWALPTFGKNINGTAQHTLRATAQYKFRKLTLASQIHSSFIPTSSDSGFAFMQAAGYKGKILTLWASAAYFNTSDYLSRLYLTDRSVAYGSTSTMVYGHGVRLNILAQAALTKNITMAVRGSTLRYFDRNAISSGAQMIEGNNMTDIQLQLGIKL